MKKWGRDASATQTKTGYEDSRGKKKILLVIGSTCTVWFRAKRGLQSCHDYSDELRDYRADVLDFHARDPTVWHGVKSIL